jgi:hypothetical protein
MFESLEKELETILETVAPSFIDVDQLALLVAQDDEQDPFEGECTVHDSCLPVSLRRTAR